MQSIISLMNETWTNPVYLSYSVLLLIYVKWFVFAEERAEEMVAFGNISINLKAESSVHTIWQGAFPHFLYP